MNERPFRFGAEVTTATSADEWIGIAREVESTGYSTLFVCDHFGDRFAPLTAAATAAAVTSTLKIGTMMICNDYRHPAVLAKEAATLALLSGGRFELGIGAGWMRSDYEESGITMDSPGTRVARLAEAVSVIKSFFTDDVVSFDGDHYTVSNLAGRPTVPPEWSPKVMIGGGGRRVLSLAASQADILAVNASLATGLVGNSIATGVTAAITDEKMSWVREAAGERFDALELATTLSRIVSTDDRDAVVRTLAPTLGLTPQELLECPHVLVGSTDEMVATLLERRERWGISYVVAVGDGRHQLAPVVSRLAGR